MTENQNQKNLPQNIKDLSLKEMQERLVSLGEPAYRGRQIFSWIYHQGVSDFSEMRNLPVGLKKKLGENFRLSSPLVVNLRKAKDGVEKYLFQLQDGYLVESVLIPSGKRQTLCVSSQVGCRYRCAFCASGKKGMRRNLTAGEIVDQVLYVRFTRKVAVTHLVFMGMGEPFDNFDSVVKAIKIINHPDGLNIGSRKITVSTAGHIPGIDKFSQIGWQVELSVSLHAVDDKLRSSLMPINRLYPVKELLAACRRYTESTGRIITFEYVLLKTVNDSVEQAKALAIAAKNVGAKINLISVSPVPNSQWQPPEKEKLACFLEELKKQRANFTLRRSRGKDIQAACGQLAGEYV
ncbi:MAG: 23S rRNA (adenine(2503)-C(2))-methyltransferase RlmN [Candidatus Omnitrophica bacterium]|nr:23S rRNA (adenine(2503)-C(2))-methyltransferase RlmN [Candidatus Omnitrophota bacterium]